jgi:hypothetical protein
MMAIVHNGDAMNPEDIEKAFVAIDGVDAVVSTLGGTTADPTVDSQASGGPGSLGAYPCLSAHSICPAAACGQPAGQLAAVQGATASSWSERGRC